MNHQRTSFEIVTLGGNGEELYNAANYWQRSVNDPLISLIPCSRFRANDSVLTQSKHAQCFDSYLEISLSATVYVSVCLFVSLSVEVGDDKPCVIGAVALF